MSHQETEQEQYGTSMTVCDYVLVHQLEALRQLEESRPLSIVDFGAGAGKNGQITRRVLGDSVRITAVEGHPRTARMLASNNVYDQVDEALIQDWMAANRNQYDLAIFGDVLEHLTTREIHRVMSLCLKSFKAIIIVCPLHEIFQDEAYGNPLEIHHSYITEDFFDRYGWREKHIVRSGAWIIMNVLIDARCNQPSLTHRLAWGIFHRVVMLLQPFGLARPLVSFLKKRFLKYKWILGR